METFCNISKIDLNHINKILSEFEYEDDLRELNLPVNVREISYLAMRYLQSVVGLIGKCVHFDNYKKSQIDNEWTHFNGIFSHFGYLCLCLCFSFYSHCRVERTKILERHVYYKKCLILSSVDGFCVKLPCLIYRQVSIFITFLNFWRRKSFLGLLIPLFWISCSICPWFQSQGGFPHLCALSPVCNGFLRFTSGATPADLLAISMAVELFHPHTCTCIQALVGIKSGMKCAAASQNVSRQKLY